MLVFSELFRRMCPLAACGIFLFQIGAKMNPSQVSQRPDTFSGGHPISVVIRTDHEKYSRAETVKLDVSLQNTGDATIYVDRRIFCCGIGSGLELEVRDEQGKRVPLPVLTEEIMPPPKEGDASILIPLDQGFFYGTWLDLPVKDTFPKPGKYSIQVVYKSWLRKEWVAPQLRDLPALWEDTREIPSEPVWIEVRR